MSDEEIEREARALQAQPLKTPGNPPRWDDLTAKSKEFWREKARRGERSEPKAAQ